MIAGITGHQILGDPATIEWSRKTLVDEIERYSVTLGLSSLAIGADQLFVEALRDCGRPYAAVVPCAGYASLFRDEARATYELLLRDATQTYLLPFQEPSELAFLAAGKWIVARSEVLLAVWDAKPARGLGGTADVVAYAEQIGRTWVHLNPVERSVIVHNSFP